MTAHALKEATVSLSEFTKCISVLRVNGVSLLYMFNSLLVPSVYCCGQAGAPVNWVKYNTLSKHITVTIIHLEW